jgi:hypothetical protein
MDVCDKRTATMQFQRTGPTGAQERCYLFRPKRQYIISPSACFFRVKRLSMPAKQHVDLPAKDFQAFDSTQRLNKTRYSG